MTKNTHSDVKFKENLRKGVHVTVNGKTVDNEDEKWRSGFLRSSSSSHEDDSSNGGNSGGGRYHGGGGVGGRYHGGGSGSSSEKTGSETAMRR